MTVERMLELIIWNQICVHKVSLKGYNIDKINKRYEELADDFLKPYVIDNDSKE